MSFYRLKPRFQALLRPAARSLRRFGASANQVTATTALVSVLLGVWLATNSDEPRWFLLLPLWCFLRMALNAIDGIMARELGQQSALGAYLNEMGDMIADAALYAPFALVAGASGTLVALVVFLAFLAELAGILGVLVGAGRCHDGPMGKSDRAFVFGALGLLLGLGIPASDWMTIVLAAVALALVVTLLNRIRSGLDGARRAAVRTSGK